jgi:hypothetical protein
MHKLLFPIDDNEFHACQGRLLHLVPILVADGYKVDILTPSDVVHAKAVETFKGNESVHVSLAKQVLIPTPDSFKDDLLKTFIKQTHGLFIPETDMKMYKLSAFDDFHGFILPFTYPDIDVSPYSLILMPVISKENMPSMTSDCFYSSVCFLAKENKVPLIGLQTQPQVHNAFLYAKLMDYIVVKEDWEREYLEQLGIEKERIFLLTDEREAYCLKSVEDPYMNAFVEFMDNKDFEMGKKDFCVLVMNHPKFRPQTREVLSVLGQMDIPLVVFVVKFGYSVQELTEEDVIESVYGDVIKKMKCKVYFAGRDTKSKLFLLSDIMVSATYWEILSLAARYRKTSIVYNKIFRDLETGDGIIFMDDPKELKEMILKRYNEKKAGYSCLSDLVGRLCKGGI